MGYHWIQHQHILTFEKKYENKMIEGDCRLLMENNGRVESAGSTGKPFPSLILFSATQPCVPCLLLSSTLETCISVEFSILSIAPKHPTSHCS